MRDYVDIGSSPSDEECAQVGEENYSAKARKECRALIEQLRRVHGPEKGTAELRIKSNPHDFGTYHEVVCYYDENDEVGADYAYACENLPEHWDTEAKKELGLIPQ